MNTELKAQFRPHFPNLEEGLICSINEATPKVAIAMSELVTIVSKYETQRVDQGQLEYAELSIGYLANASGVGWETARRAWNRVREKVGWFSVHISKIREMDLKIRERRKGRKWGQHLLLPRASVEACKAASRVHGQKTNQKPVKDHFRWHKVQPRKAGSNMFCPCPFHNDGNPSMLMNLNSDGVSGGAYCFGCQASAYWVRTEEGFFVRKPKRESSQYHDEYNIKCITPQEYPLLDIKPKGHVVGHHLLGRLSSKGMKRRASKCSDLFDALLFSDRRSLTESNCFDAHARFSAGLELVEQYISVEPMAPTQWRRVKYRGAERNIPMSWTPTSAKYVLIDLDGFTSCPVSVDKRIARVVKQVTEAEPLLSGKFAVIQTSRYGLQFVFELKEEKYDAKRWYSSKSAQSLFERLDFSCLEIARHFGFKGGHADSSAHHCGRLMRRPGWRKDKSGELARAKLICTHFFVWQNTV